MEEATSLLSTEEPLEAEVFASVVAGIAYRLFADQPEVEGAFWADVLWTAEQEGSPRALALLLALAALAPHRVAGTAEATARRLLRGPAVRPPWAGAAGDAAFAGAWLMAPAGSDREVVVLCSQHPGRVPHALFVVLDRRRQLALDAGLGVDAATALADSARSLSPSEVRPIRRAVAAARLAGALAAADAGRGGGELTEDFCDLRALIAVRVAGPSRPTPDLGTGTWRPAASPPAPVGVPAWPPPA
ncbi:MAG TPA: hypothetical protein VFD49_03300 [Candidatus Dormibacteraeota bacterium]|nr:hypothetical protein [Candidatus Dormibacteraeota bacterium]